jgi:hypothetical protein
MDGRQELEVRAVEETFRSEVESCEDSKEKEGRIKGV